MSLFCACEYSEQRISDTFSPLLDNGFLDLVGRWELVFVLRLMSIYTTLESGRCV